MKIQLLVDDNAVWESDELVGMTEPAYLKERDEVEELIAENDYEYTLTLVGGTDADKDVFDTVGCRDDLEIGGVLYMMWSLGQQNTNRMHSVLIEIDSDGNLTDNDEIESAISRCDEDDHDAFGMGNYAYAYGVGETLEEARVMCAKSRHYHCVMGEMWIDDINWDLIAGRLTPLRTHTWGGKHHVLDYVINPSDC